MGSRSAAIATFCMVGSSFAQLVLPRQTTTSFLGVAIPTASLSSLVASAASSASLAPYIKPSQVCVRSAKSSLGRDTNELIQKVETVLAIGDSYTAGIGSNGRPDYYYNSFDCRRYRSSYPIQLVSSNYWRDFNGGDLPSLIFGACSGAKMADLRAKQLEQGIPNPNLEYTNIGQPQLAVVTITGNDVGFSEQVSCAQLLRTALT